MELLRDFSECEQAIDYEKDQQVAFNAAKEQGLTVITAPSNYLFCDLDTKEALSRFNQVKLKLDFIHDYVVAESKSGNKHAIIKCTKCLSREQQLYYQLMLGSDLKREYCNFSRFMEDEEHVDNNIFATPDMVNRLKAKGWLDELLVED